jgi:type I restriction enzyme S subunit
MSFDAMDSCLGAIIAEGQAELQTGPFGTMLKAEEYSSEGTPVISVGEVREGYLEIGSKTPRVSDKTIARLPRFLLKQNDIVFGRKGSTHRNALIKEGEEGYFLGSDGIRLRVKSDCLCPKYLSYQLRSAKAVSWLKANSEGTTMPSLNQDILSRFPITLLPFADQKAIAHILGTLDDKIELNRKTNETLESIAKALFKSWFVGFDPVRAKAEGCPTGLPAEISDLFPDSFEDSELGEIPSGWKVGTIASSVGEVFDGPHATPKEADEGNIFLGIKNMTGSSLDLSHVKLICTDDWSQWTRRVEPRAEDIVFTYEAALGLFAVIPDGLKCCLGRRMALIRSKVWNGTPYFWFHQFIAKPFQKVIEERSIHGATVNRTPLTEFPGYPILEAPESLRLAFEQAASALWARIHTEAKQSASLASLRDALLPKLISGELRIPDAEKMLEEVGV